MVTAPFVGFVKSPQSVGGPNIYKNTVGFGIGLSTARPKWRLDGPALSFELILFMQIAATIT